MGAAAQGRRPLAANDASGARAAWRGAHVFALAFQTIEDGLISRIRKATVATRGLIRLEPGAQSLGSGKGVRLTDDQES